LSAYQESRLRAYRSVNKELIDLYWGIGREIAERQERDGWGKSVVERLSRDLRKEFLETSGFSSQNLWYMRQFYLEYREYPTSCWRNTLGAKSAYYFQDKRLSGTGILPAYDSGNGLESKCPATSDSNRCLPETSPYQKNMLIHVTISLSKISN